MKRKTLKLLSLLMVLALACGVLAACGGDGGGQSTPAAASTPPAADSGDDSAPAPAGDKPVLQFWALPYGAADVFNPALQSVIDTYNEGDHGATVELQVLSWSGFAEQIQTAIAGGSPPDVTVASYHGLLNYAAMGEALDLSDIVARWEAEGDPILDDLMPAQLEYGKFQGEQIALPFKVDGRAVYYRADILEDELGFTDLDKPVSWDKFMEICEAIKQNYGDEGVYPHSFFTMDMGSTVAMMNILISNGCGWLTEDGQPAMDDPRAVACLEWIGEMRDKGYFPEGMVSYNQAEVEKLYSTGKIMMAWKGNFSHTKADEELYKNTKVMGPIVGPDADEPLMCAWSDGMLAFKQTKYPEETKEFVEWFLKNNESLFVEGGTGSLPVRKSYLENSFFEDDWLTGQYAQYSDYFVLNSWRADEIPLATNQVYVQGMLGAPMEAVLMGSNDYQGEMEKANEAIKKVFADLN
ncbi:extracellular solute-binding protein [Ruminococcaceae bacterium OttesenSCG-928-D13]|nr:extracellular solute-binding protein [Ruminococcaceae bacterium OttesenSCG-928-D13]